MSFKPFILCLLLLISSTLAIIHDFTTDSTKIYPYMQISMDILITTTPLNCSTIFFIDKFLSISITSHNILQVQIVTNPIHNHPIIPHTIYTLNITLNPSNNHYSLHSSSDMQTFPFTVASIQYIISHTLVINDKYAQITNLRIISDEAASNTYLLYSYSTSNNKIFLKINNNSLTTSQTAEDDQYESIFGPNVTELQEIIFIAIIMVGLICLLAIIAYAIAKKCNQRKKNKFDKQSSYEKINIRGGAHSVVHFVDEKPGNNDVNVFKDAQIPLTPAVAKKCVTEKEEKRSERKEGEDVKGNIAEVGVANTLDTTGLIKTAGNDSDDNSVLTRQIVFVEREDSMSAMNI